METGERLAAYLAGDLDTDEARRLEGELARDPSLRERLARLRRLEDELVALPEVEVPLAFSEQLRARVRRELDEYALPGRAVAGNDELSARRHRRGWGGLPSWLPAAAGAAAVLVAVVAVGVSLPRGGGDDSADEGMALDAMTETEALEESAGGEMGSAMRAAEGPVVVDEGAGYDADAVRALATGDALRTVTGRSLTADAASEVAASYTEAFGVAPSPSEESGGTAAQDGADGDTAAAPAPGVTVRGEVEPEDLEAVRACLAGLLPEEETVIPAYAELATFDGEPAIVYGVITEDPGTGSFTRVQLWVVGRADCEVLFYAQDDGG